jgi:CheY-like chemotaxis protein/Tfp pilus assembly protein PilZ
MNPKKVLISDDLQPMLLQHQNVLTRSNIAVFPAASNDDILKIHLQEKVHLIVTRLSMPGIRTDELFSIIRQTPDLQHVSILMLREDTIGQRELSKRCKCNAVMVLPVSADVLHQKTQELLEIPTRQAYRIVFNVAVDGKFGNQPFMCHMENLSSAGMLIRTEQKFSLGMAISCTFYLPDGTRVVTLGEVVRNVAQLGLQTASLYGIKFTEINDADKKAIERFIAKSMAN